MMVGRHVNSWESNEIGERGSRAAEPEITGSHGAHVPVMLDEVLLALQPQCGQIIVDGTFGAGGYSQAIIDAGAGLFAIDKDPNARMVAAEFSRKYDKRFCFVNADFGTLDAHCLDRGLHEVDGVVLDVGVSSMQLDQAKRGFSFMKDGPLDMRMGQTGMSAGDIVNRAEPNDLTRIIAILGEERHARRVSRAIVARREKKVISSTLDLAAIIEKTLGRKFSDKIHPATRTFQALRIFVNKELEQLAHGLFAAERILKTGGKLVVVTFHSLEDRIVKRFFANRCDGQIGSRHLPHIKSAEPGFRQQKRGALRASDEEIEINARARSAKLRWGQRTSAKGGPTDLSIFGREVTLSLSGRLL